jgi:murein L,D-transpeptidase YcbB/YkuD
LSAEDYDGARWASRLAKLKPAVAKPTEADAVNFDLALIVSVMRHISDPHIGKVNPKHFDFGLDVEGGKYDLLEFLKDHVVDAPDVSGVLQQVEPPYPGYQRTIKALQTYLQLAKESDGTPLPGIQKTIYEGALVDAVKNFQRRLGRTPDGRINAPDFS